MDLVEFLKKQRPICTRFPLYRAMEDDFELYVALSKRCKKEFNENLLGKQCSRYLLCTDECLGRPIPQYPELEPYLVHLANYEEGTYKGRPVWVTKATLCVKCPFKESCGAACGTVEDFLGRDTDLNEPLESKIIQITNPEEESYVWESLTHTTGYSGAEIPWGILTELQKKVIKLRIYSGLEYDDIAERLYITKQVAWRHFKNGLKKLKKHQVDKVRKGE